MKWREMPLTRSVEVRHGDDLRAIALRELGDAALWTELVVINGLRPPYIADRPGPGVVAPGETLRVPTQDRREPQGDSFLADLRTEGGRLVVRGGTLALADGLDNLRQSLRRRLEVGRRELQFHPTYGSFLPQLVGMRGNGAASLAARYAQEALMQDFRVRLARVQAQVSGDAVAVSATVEPVSGGEQSVAALVG